MWFSYLSSAHLTVGSSILFTRTTRCFTPAVLANMACSLREEWRHAMEELFVDSPCLSLPLKSCLKLTTTSWYHLQEEVEQQNNATEKIQVSFFLFLYLLLFFFCLFCSLTLSYCLFVPCLVPIVHLSVFLLLYYYYTLVYSCIFLGYR